jgi:hypothetical protein
MRDPLIHHYLVHLSLFSQFRKCFVDLESHQDLEVFLEYTILEAHFNHFFLISRQFASYSRSTTRDMSNLLDLFAQIILRRIHQTIQFHFLQPSFPLS